MKELIAAWIEVVRAEFVLCISECGPLQTD